MSQHVGHWSSVNKPEKVYLWHTHTHTLFPLFLFFLSFIVFCFNFKFISSSSHLYFSSSVLLFFFLFQCCFLSLTVALPFLSLFLLFSYLCCSFYLIYTSFYFLSAPLFSLPFPFLCSSLFFPVSLTFLLMDQVSSSSLWNGGVVIGQRGTGLHSQEMRSDWLVEPPLAELKVCWVKEEVGVLLWLLDRTGTSLIAHHCWLLP